MVTHAQCLKILDHLLALPLIFFATGPGLPFCLSLPRFLLPVCHGLAACSGGRLGCLENKKQAESCLKVTAHSLFSLFSFLPKSLSVCTGVGWQGQAFHGSFLSMSPPPFLSSTKSSSSSSFLPRSACNAETHAFHHHIEMHPPGR